VVKPIPHGRHLTTSVRRTCSLYTVPRRYTHFAPMLLRRSVWRAILIVPPDVGCVVDGCVQRRGAMIDDGGRCPQPILERFSRVEAGCGIGTIARIRIIEQNPLLQSYSPPILAQRLNRQESAIRFKQCSSPRNAGVNGHFVHYTGGDQRGVAVSPTGV
jgi:hypothetical protein